MLGQILGNMHLDDQKQRGFQEVLPGKTEDFFAGERSSLSRTPIRTYNSSTGFGLSPGSEAAG
jgi:hypothetical protein